MLESPANFFYGAFDPVGFISLDKPPAAVWVQAASARVFGYRGLSLLAPQAVLGVGSVILTYYLVRRSFGAGAGLLAGLFLAITPVCVADDRTNLPDTSLVFVLLLAAWALAAAVESGRTRLLFLSAAFVGVGYNIKMLAAFVVLPTFCLVYLLFGPLGLWQRLRQLSLAAVVTGAVSLSWSLAVDCTPPARRPYLGGSRTNSALELALGYNGLDRVFGRLAKPGSTRGWANPGVPGSNAADPVAGGMPGFGGNPGWLRFAAPAMAGQITWLAPLALVGTAAAAARRVGKGTAGPALVLWVGWLATHWALFSFARGVVHEYYTAVMGPAVSALAGAGSVALWAAWRRGGASAALLPLAIVLTVAWQASLIGQFPEWGRWLLPPMLALAGGGLVGLIAARGLAARQASTAWWERLAAGLALASLLIGPAAWSLIPVLAKGDSMIPLADPSALAPAPEGIPLPGRPAFELDPPAAGKLAEFLLANRHSERIMMASMESFLAAPLIIERDLPVIALGGFSGSDRALSAGQLSVMVARGEVRFVLLVAGQSRANADLLEWVRLHGRPVAADFWRREERGNHSTPGTNERTPVARRRALEPSAAEIAAREVFARLRSETTLYDLRPDRELVAPEAAR
jgi:4-amino-4-deoxy-L-arabinose transferase-like glycosyltransferase